MTIDKAKMRAEFEVWCRNNNGVPAMLKGTDQYIVPVVQGSWQAWKASAESYEKKLAEKEVAKEAAASDWSMAGEIAQLQHQLSEANARNARLVDAITKNHQWHIFDDDAGDYEGSELWNENTKAISANSEAVAAWEAEKLEPLRKEVAMLHDASVSYFDSNGRDCSKLIEALRDTQATAEAYEREVMAKALEDGAKFLFTLSFAHESDRWLRGICADNLKMRATELRAANKGKEIV